jgi:F-type H+/Na+-transporting ATPase subunit alpha
MRNEGKGILDAIRTDKALKENTEADLRKELDKFSKNFA